MLVAAAIIFPFKSAVADWNWVPTGSMRPSILEGELVFINKLAYDLKVPFTTVHMAEWSNPTRGEVVVCYSPHDGTRLVKRVVGLPGDRVVVAGSRVWVNDKPVPYARAASSWRRHLNESEQIEAIVATETLDAVQHPMLVRPAREAFAVARHYTVPEGHYFMMGDNRDQSFDSRYFGAVPRKQIIGSAEAVVLSFNPDRWLLPRADRFFKAL
jgi:signal peptidase I